MMQAPLIMQSVSRTFGEGATEVTALSDADLVVNKGEMVAVMGPSGSGKSTLLTLAGGLDIPTSGQVMLHGTNIAEMTKNQRAAIRRQQLGYVFQDLNLLNSLTALENVAMPLELDGWPAKTASKAAAAALDTLGLAAKTSAFPEHLSGGEQQRVAIARSIVGDRSLILADEPTGALDSENSDQVMQTLTKLCTEGSTVVLVTHDARLAAWANRIIFLNDGRIVDESAPTPIDFNAMVGGN